MTSFPIPVSTDHPLYDVIVRHRKEMLAEVERSVQDLQEAKYDLVRAQSYVADVEERLAYQRRQIAVCGDALGITP